MSEAETRTASPGGRGDRIRTIAYWVCTVLVAFEMVAGGLWDLLRIEYVRAVIEHLGYPLYILFVIGIWKIPCGMALLAPRFPRLKEWAYAGAFFNYFGAVASHLLRGDGPGVWTPPLLMVAFTMTSWALRPPTRRVAGQEIRTRPMEWVLAGAIVAVMMVLSLITLPRGRPAY